MNQPADPELRLRAEKELKSRPNNTYTLRGAEEAQRFIHEFEVHQIELEIQNEELRQMRDEMEKSLNEYTDIYDFAPVGYLTFNNDGVICSANLFIATLFGVDRSCLTGKQFAYLIDPVSRPTFENFIAIVFTEHKTQTCELKLLNHSCCARFVQVEAMSTASRTECRAAVIDITMRREMEEQIEKQHQELVASNIDLDAFNYTVAHDLRTPLTTINGYCQLLQGQFHEQLNEQAKGYLQEIFDGTQCMSRLISTLLDFSSASRRTLHCETVDLSSMAEAVVDELIQTSPECRDIFQLASGIVCQGDTDLLRVAMDNLLGNAWKFAGKHQGAKITFGKAMIDEETVFFVKDNGPGFDVADAEEMFLPFHRLPGTIGGGHGIGLATVNRIVQQHGGRLWSESEAGIGATFFFTVG